MSGATTVTPLDRLAELITADSASVLASTRQMLRIARQHLDLEIAFVSEFVDGRRVFRAVDSDLDDCPIREGDSDLLDDSFCRFVVDGSLPRLMTDAGQHPVAAAMQPASRATPPSI
jgi:hypothetical protein